MSKQLIGTEEFTLDGNPTGMTMSDFWRFMYSNIYSFQEVIAEFLVAKALGKEVAENDAYWTLFDMKYRDKRIEVKQTSYYHSFNEENKVSNHRVFRIPKSNSKFEYDIAINKEKYKDVGDKEKENKYERQNDIYVFCVNTGENRSDAYPLNLNNWEFYIVPTYVHYSQASRHNF